VQVADCRLHRRRRQAADALGIRGGQYRLGALPQQRGLLDRHPLGGQHPDPVANVVGQEPALGLGVAVGAGV
jgi:hypothetical protein